jgi:DNA-binding IclR family transcriptional regulator
MLRSPAVRLLKHLYANPMLTVRKAESLLGVQFATAARALEVLESEGVVRETTGQRRHRRYRFEPYLALFAAGNPSVPSEATDRADRASREATIATKSNEE